MKAELILSLIRKGMSLDEAEAFAEDFFAANPIPAPAPAAPAAKPRGAYDLSEAQEAALESGVGLCPNCQQPKNDHLPGCSRAIPGTENDPFLKGAITKNKLNPVA